MTGAEAAGQNLRLFVAIELPEAWLASLTEAQRRLQQRLVAAGVPRLRWVHPEGIHITLKFLGNVAGERLPSIEEALAATIAEPPGLTLRLQDPGWFLSRRRVSVIWAGVGGDMAGLSRLAGRIDAACEPLGFTPERRPFAAHLTLARVPEGVELSPETLARQLQTLDLAGGPPFRVRHVSLMLSRLGPGGSRYERLAR